MFGLAAAARAAYLFVYRPQLESYYLGLADSLVTTGVLGIDGTPSTAFEPVYPVFLAAARLMFGDRFVLIQLLQVGVAAAGAVLLYCLTRKLTSSQPTAVVAGALFALHPLLVKQASAASDLPIATTLLVAFALAFVRTRDLRTAALAGALIGATVLTRSMVIPVVALGTAILLIQKQRRQAAAFVLAAAVVIAPMAVRTYHLSGVFAPTRSGVNLYIGNSPHTAALLPTYDLDLLEIEAHERFTSAHPDVNPDHARFEAEFDAFLTRQAIAHMAERPWATIRQKMLNVAFLFSPRIVPFMVSGPDTRVHFERDAVMTVEHSVPRPRSEIAAHAVTSLVLLLGCAAGVAFRRRELHRDAVLWAIAATFIAVNAIYVPATRYTAPVQFVLIFYAAVALVRVRVGVRRAVV